MPQGSELSRSALWSSSLISPKRSLRRFLFIIEGLLPHAAFGIVRRKDLRYRIDRGGGNGCGNGLRPAFIAGVLAALPDFLILRKHRLIPYPLAAASADLIDIVH